MCVIGLMERSGKLFGFSFFHEIYIMIYSSNQLLQGGIVDTMTGNCLFYFILTIDVHFLGPNMD
jgi:hypothetical protein